MKVLFTVSLGACKVKEVFEFDNNASEEELDEALAEWVMDTVECEHSRMPD